MFLWKMYFLLLLLLLYWSLASLKMQPLESYLCQLFTNMHECVATVAGLRPMFCTAYLTEQCSYSSKPLCHYCAPHLHNAVFLRPGRSDLLAAWDL